jgi:tubulin--tyrosine ligase-like protein 12
LSRASPEKRVNQFPYEGVVTVKDLLAVVCARDLRAAGENAVEWMPKTFNLQTELVPFVSTFQRREKEYVDFFFPLNHIS